MKRTIVVVAVLFFFHFSIIVANAEQDYPVTKHIVVDGKTVKLEHGLDLSGKDLRNIEIHNNHCTFKNINFSDCNLTDANFLETIFVNCSFQRAKLINLPYLVVATSFSERQWRDGYGHVVTYDKINESSDFTDAEIEDIKLLAISRKQLESTATFKRKSLRGIYFSTCDFRGVNFSGFDLQKVDFGYSLLNNCDFTDAITGEGTVLGSNRDFQLGMSYEQLRSTKSYKEGNLVNVYLNLTWPEGHVDFSKMNLTGSYFGPGGTYNHINIDNLRNFYASDPKPERRGWSDQCQLDLTDSVITNCKFHDFKGLTLENIKSTWNYKHNRMEGIKLPQEIQAALDAEKEK